MGLLAVNNALLNGSTFTNNTASTGGGAVISTETQSNMELAFCTFTTNQVSVASATYAAQPCVCKSAAV